MRGHIRETSRARGRTAAGIDDVRSLPSRGAGESPLGADVPRRGGSILVETIVFGATLTLVRFGTVAWCRSPSHLLTSLSVRPRAEPSGLARQRPVAFAEFIDTARLGHSSTFGLREPLVRLYLPLRMACTNGVHNCPLVLRLVPLWGHFWVRRPSGDASTMAQG